MNSIDTIGISLNPQSYESKELLSKVAGDALDALERRFEQGKPYRMLVSLLRFLAGDVCSLIIALSGTVGIAVAAFIQSGWGIAAIALGYFMLQAGSVLSKKMQALQLEEKSAQNEQSCKEALESNEYYDALENTNSKLKLSLNRSKTVFEKTMITQLKSNEEIFDLSRLCVDSSYRDLGMSGLNSKCQRVAMASCESIGAYVKEHFGVKPYVTVFQSFPANEEMPKGYWKMIGYGPYPSECPRTFDYKYPCDDSSQYFVQIANNPDCNRTFALSSHDEIIEKFDMHEGSETRERNVCRYIGRPVLARDNSVPFVIQVDSSSECLGSSVEELRENFGDILQFHASAMLRLYYEGLMLRNIMEDIDG